MKKLTRKSLDELAKTMPVLHKKEQGSFVGGGQDSCVFNCFDYLDSGLYTASHYYEYTLKYLGYEPDGSGNVQTADIPTIGSYGGFQVNQLSGGSGVILTSNGYTSNGERLIMTFNVGNQGHAVVVTGAGYEEGKPAIYYYDPTTGKTGYKNNNEYSALYSVGTLYIDYPVTGIYSGTVNPSGNYIS